MAVVALPQVQIGEKRFFQDDRLHEYRRVDNPHERITFDQLDELILHASSDEILMALEPRLIESCYCGRPVGSHWPPCEA